MKDRPILVLQQVAHEGPGFLSQLLEARHAPSQIVSLHRGDPIPDPKDCRALIVLGGPMNVYEEKKFPQLAAQDIAIKRAIELSIPYLGICLGGQLLAKALGAPVMPNPGKEIGFYQIDLTPEGRKDPILQGLNAHLSVFQWHGDTFAIPDGAVQLASAHTCSNQAFRYGTSAYAIQFHLETTPQMIRQWACIYREELMSEGIATETLTPSDLDQRCAELRQSAELTLNNFLALTT
jgi:GMP synthase-like glutamine amidotransferase